MVILPPRREFNCKLDAWRTLAFINALRLTARNLVTLPLTMTEASIEELKELAWLVRCGQLFDVQAWLANGRKCCNFGGVI